MICPVCNEGKIALCKDAIVSYAMYESNGVPDVSNILLETNDLDSSWVECSRCHATSEDNVLLLKIYNKIGNYQVEMTV